MLFLNGLEHQFDVDLIRQLRDVGVKVSLVTTNALGDDPVSSLH